MVTGSEPAGRKTSANPHASAAAPITTASASRTAERGDRITETPADKGSLQIGEGDPDGNSVAHAVGQALAPPSIVPIAAAAEVPKFLRARPNQVPEPLRPRSPDACCTAPCAHVPARRHPQHHGPRDTNRKDRRRRRHPPDERARALARPAAARGAA